MSRGEDIGEATAQATSAQAATPTVSSVNSPEKWQDQGDDGEPTGAAASEEVEIESEIYKLRFTIAVSMRYHSARRAWFDRLHRTTIILTALGSSAAVGAITATEPGLAIWFAAVAAILATVDFAVRYSERAREHDSAYREFCDLAASVDGTENPTKTDLSEWFRRMRRIEADEPSSLDALNVHFHNVEVEARGLTEYRYKLTGPQRFFKHLFTFPPNRFERESAASEPRGEA